MRALLVALPLLLAAPLATATSPPAGVDLDLTLRQLELEVEADVPASFAFKVTNNGTINATDIVVLLVMPEGATFVEGHRCTSEDDGETAVCSGEPLSPGSMFSYTFYVVFEEPGAYTIEGEAWAEEDELNEVDNGDALVVTVGDAPPNPPVGDVTCIAGATGVTVSWGVNDFVQHYNVYRAEAGGEAELLADGLVAQAYLDATAEANTTYEYYVTAVRVQGETELGEPCIVTSIPEFPSLLVAAAVGTIAVVAYATLRRR